MEYYLQTSFMIILPFSKRLGHSVLITRGQVYSLEKQSLKQTLLEDRNVISGGYGGAPEPAGMVQLKNSPKIFHTQADKTKSLLKTYFINCSAELSNCQCAPLHPDSPERIQF